MYTRRDLEGFRKISAKANDKSRVKTVKNFEKD